MRLVLRLTVLGLCFAALAALGSGQPPREKEGPKDGPGGTSGVDAFVARMMAFDKNKDGKLTRDEITDERLLRLFDQADANKDGVVTKEELVALATKMVAEEGTGRRGGPGGPGGPGGRGPGGPGGFGGPPQPGQILPPFLQDRLELTAAQKKQLSELQKEVDGKLASILTAEQKKQLSEMRDGMGRGGPGGPGGRGPGGPGGPGGRGPGGPGGPKGPPDR